MNRKLCCWTITVPLAGIRADPRPGRSVPGWSSSSSHARRTVTALLRDHPRTTPGGSRASPALVKSSVDRIDRVHFTTKVILKAPDPLPTSRFQPSPGVETDPRALPSRASSPPRTFLPPSCRRRTRSTHSFSKNVIVNVEFRGSFPDPTLEERPFHANSTTARGSRGRNVA